MADKTPQEKYAEAFELLLKAKKEVIDDQSNPFSLDLPTHSGLPEETFITDEELEQLTEKVGKAASDNRKFARLWNVGTDVVAKAKSIIK